MGKGDKGERREIKGWKKGIREERARKGKRLGFKWTWGN
jgi:hypothetical protein